MSASLAASFTWDMWWEMEHKTCCIDHSFILVLKVEWKDCSLPLFGYAFVGFHQQSQVSIINSIILFFMLIMFLRGFLKMCLVYMFTLFVNQPSIICSTFPSLGNFYLQRPPTSLFVLAFVSLITVTLFCTMCQCMLWKSSNHLQNAAALHPISLPWSTMISLQFWLNYTGFLFLVVLNSIAHL